MPCSLKVVFGGSVGSGAAVGVGAGVSVEGGLASVGMLGAGCELNPAGVVKGACVTGAVVGDGAVEGAGVSVFASRAFTWIVDVAAAGSAACWRVCTPLTMNQQAAAMIASNAGKKYHGKPRRWGGCSTGCMGVAGSGVIGIVVG